MTGAPAAITWLGAARPRTLAAAIVPVVVGTACAAAEAGMRVAVALAALGGAIALQVACNFANDVFDAQRGADGVDRIGPARAVASGAISASAMKLAMIAALVVALGFGIALTASAGWPVVVVGTCSMIAAVGYTAGPYPLAYHGLGDVCVLAFFGFVAVATTAYVQLGRVPAIAWPAGLAVGCLATAILVVNNLRDREGDARVGKRTLAVRWGRRATLVWYAALLATAYVATLAIALSTASVAPLAPLATAPLAIVRVRELAAASQRSAPHAFARSLASTAALLVAFGILLAIGVAWS